VPLLCLTLLLSPLFAEFSTARFSRLSRSILRLSSSVRRSFSSATAAWYTESASRIS